MGEIAAAYDYLSKADILSSRITKRQAFTLYKYFPVIAQGIAVSKKESSKRFVMYRVPKAFYPKWDNTAAQKIAKELHVSKSEVDLDLIRLVAKKNSDILQKFGLDEDEKASLLSN